ncbi:hypothetical protein [Mycolicibacterium sp. XJ870]
MSDEDDNTRILRRQPEAAQSRPVPTPVPNTDEPKTSIIRRHPTGAIPTVGDAEPKTSLIPGSSGTDAQTGLIPGTAGTTAETGLIGSPADDTRTSYIPQARPVAIPRTAANINPRSAVATAVLSILSGWATGVIATDLIAGWWRTDQLFCVAIGFLAAISAAATIGGLIALLLRRRMGRLLIVVGSTIGLLIFGSLFIAGAKFHPVVYAMPALPVASILFTLLPSTARWSAGARS